MYMYVYICEYMYECQISTIDRVQNKAAKFAPQMGGPVWEPLAQCRRTSRMCALYKAYNSDIGDRLHRHHTTAVELITVGK
jgi:hypothetical protein